MSGWVDNVVEDRYRSSRKRGKPMGKGAPHIPNKAERKLLTTMMQTSGQTEEQVRASKSNRQKLAKAAKSMSQPKPDGHRQLVERRRCQRQAALIMGIPAYDPRVTKAVNSYMLSTALHGRGGWFNTLSEHCAKFPPEKKKSHLT